MNDDEGFILRRGESYRVRKRKGNLGLVEEVEALYQEGRCSEVLGEAPPSITPGDIREAIDACIDDAKEDGRYVGECPTPCPKDCESYSEPDKDGYCSLTICLGVYTSITPDLKLVE